MLRYRFLSGVSDERLTLKTIYKSGPYDDFIGPLGLQVECDFTEGASSPFIVREAVKIQSEESLTEVFPFPSYDLIEEEVQYMFNLLNQLKPYETSQTQPQNFPQVSDQPRRDPFLEDEIPF